jgi:uncharacterized delta-60 repeat protein
MRVPARDEPRSKLFAGTIALCALILAIVAARALAAAGALDHSFSSDGKRTFAFANGLGADAATATAIQHDGKIVLAGYSDQGGGSTGHDFAVIRLNPNGSLDQTFSGDGRRTIAIGAGVNSDDAFAMKIQHDGRIILAGRSDQGPSKHNDFAVVRLKSNGGTDTSFSGDGRRTLGFGNGARDDEAYGLAIQRDGKIVLGGESDQGTPTGYQMALARLNPNGSLDHTFSGDGRRLLGFRNGAGFDDAAAVAVQRDGRIVTCGESRQGPTNGDEFALARFKPNGNLDQTFSDDGRRTLSVAAGNGGDVCLGMALQGDGKIVGAGYAFQSSTPQFAVVRLKPSGDVDHGFSGDGRRIIGLGDGGYGRAVALQGNGDIVVAGDTHRAASGTDFALVRVTPNGDVDHTFSGDGRVVTAFGNGSGYDSAQGIAIQANGRIVVAGQSHQPLTSIDFGVARFLGPPQSVDSRPLLENLGIEFGPYDPSTGKAGDFVFANGVSEEADLDKAFLEFGATVSGPDGPKLLPTFEYRGLAPDALVRSMTDGKVVAVQDQGEDFEVRVSPGDGSTWLLIYDHLIALTVNQGDQVKSGQTLGKPSGGTSARRFEIQIDHGNNFLCPLEVADPKLVGGLEAQISQLQRDWESFRKNTAIYDEASQVRPGCNYRKLKSQGGDAVP